MPLSPHTAIPPPPRRRSSNADKAVSGMSGGGDMTLTTQQTTSTISPPQTPTLQQRCSQLHTSLMNCTIIELQTLSNQLSLDTTNCNNKLDYINLIENFSRSKKKADTSVDDDVNCKCDSNIQSTPPINIDNQQEQIDAEHMNDHNTPDDILPQDNDYRSHLQTQLHTTLQSLSLIELQSLATRLSIDYSNCLHDKIDENFIQKGVIQDGSEGDTSSDERKENAIIEKLARQHVMQLIEERALNLPIVLECGSSNTNITDDDGMNGKDDDDTSVISAITTYTCLVNSAKQNSNHTSNVDSTELATGYDNNHNTLSNNYREYLQSIRNGGYESYEGNNGSDNNVVRLLSHKEEEADEVQNENEVQAAVDYSEISKEEQVVHQMKTVQPLEIVNGSSPLCPPSSLIQVTGAAVQSSSQYPIPLSPPPPPPRRQKMNQRVPVAANNGVIPKEQQHFHLPPPPPPPPPPPRRNEGRSLIESSVIDNKFSPPKSTIGDSKAASISQTDIYVTNEASQKADTEIDNDKQEEFLDAMSELALQINGTLMDIVPTADDSPQSNNNKQEEFDIDSLIPKNPSHNRSTEECMIKEQYKEYLYPDDESLNDSSYKLHMKQVVNETSTDTNKSDRHRGQNRRSKKSSRKKKLEVLSSVSESTTALDTSSASSASDSDSSDNSESDDDKLTDQTSKLVANLQDYISNI